jgi:hypothetical protein
MAINTAWTINKMVHKDADGGVFLVYWSCTATSDPQGDSGEIYSAVSADKLNLTYDASDPDFTPYADLTQSQVLGWVYNSLIEGDETADEAKARVEADRTAKVQEQIDRANADSTGFPWES